MVITVYIPSLQYSPMPPVYRRTVTDAGWECVTRDPESLADCSSLPALVKQHNIVAALGIHAYRSAPVLLACQVSTS